VEGKPHMRGFPFSFEIFMPANDNNKAAVHCFSGELWNDWRIEIAFEINAAEVFR
jgi:hypothetical protein